MALHLMTSSKKGISSLQMSRELDITIKSAWFLTHRIREAMRKKGGGDPLGGIVEADETYVGGKPRPGMSAKPQKRDHLAMQLALIGPARTLPNWSKLQRNIYFPIAEDASKLKAGVVGKVQVMRDDAIKAIGKIEPYKGGKGNNLWILSELNNIDKHRLLLTICSAYDSVDLATPLQKKAQKLVDQHWEYKVALPVMSVFYKVEDRQCPLNIGDELFAAPLDRKEYEQMNFRLEIAFNEPRIIQGQSVVPFLHQLCNLVDGIITNFDPLL
jgi:hypothetical protein